MKPIILASTSPRRKAILRITGLRFRAVGSDVEEDMMLPLAPRELAKRLSRDKAEAVARRLPHHIVIGADTFVTLGNRVLGKPHTPIKARAMLRAISGQTVGIVTGFTIIHTESARMVSRAVTTSLRIKRLSEQEIRDYVRTKEPLDKAGAFAIQGIGATLIERINGDYFAALGLPLFALVKELKKFDDIDVLANYTKTTLSRKR